MQDPPVYGPKRRGFPIGDKALLICDCNCNDPKGHGHPSPSNMEITYVDYEYLQTLCPTLLPYRHGFVYKLEKYLPRKFYCQMGFNQITPTLVIKVFYNGEPKLFSFPHDFKVRPEDLVKSWDSLLRVGARVHALEQPFDYYGRQSFQYIDLYLNNFSDVWRKSLMVLRGFTPDPDTPKQPLEKGKEATITSSAPMDTGKGKEKVTTIDDEDLNLEGYDGFLPSPSPEG